MSGTSPTAAVTRLSTSTSRGCAASSARRRHSRDQLGNQIPTDALYKGINNRFEWRRGFHGGPLRRLLHSPLYPSIQTKERAILFLGITLTPPAPIPFPLT